MRINLLMLSILVFASPTFGQEKHSSSFEYPELLVTPKASERLQREVQQESSRAWSAHVPVQASALVTLYAASLAMSDKSENKDAEKAKKADDKTAGAGQIGTLVSGGWLASTVIMSALYRPYRSCYAKIPKNERKNREAMLARERAAEECLEDPARMARRINLLSAATNVLAGAYIAGTAQEDMTKSMGALAAITAFAPFLFSYHWQDVAEYHQDYKRRIYGPVTEFGIIPSVVQNKLVPAISLSYRY